MTRLTTRIAVVIASVLSVVALATAPAAAQNSHANGASAVGQAMAQLCTGTKANFKCSPTDTQLPLDTIHEYLQGNGSPVDQGSLGERIKALKDSLNKGNGAPGGSGWQGVDLSKLNDQTKAPDLSELQKKAAEYLEKHGNGNSSATNGGSGSSSGNGSSTSSGNQGNGNTNGGPSVAERCQKIQDAVNGRIGKLNTNAQASLASLDETLKKLQDYQSSVDPSQLPADYQELVQKALEAQDKATTAVATLAALNVQIDCSQSNPAQSLSVIKASADATRTQLQEFAKSVQELSASLAQKAQP